MTPQPVERACRSVLPLLLASVLGGCAGIVSAPVGRQDNVEGVAYYLPMRYFQLKVTVVDQKVTALDWSTSEAFADPGAAFALRYNAHLIGKTTVNVAVNSKGLLSMANTQTTDAIAALATVSPSSGSAKPSALIQAPAESPVNRCPDNGDYLLVFEKPEKIEVLCGQPVHINIEDAPTGAAAKASTDGQMPTKVTQTAPSSTPGIYYRINRAYLATAHVPGSGASKGQRQTRLLLAPNESPTMLLPFGRTLFAANDGDVTLNDGVLASYDQANDGELAALLKFPAAMLGAYFTAAGNVFSAFSERDTRALAVRQADLRNEILRFKLERCVDALKKNDTAALQSLQCDALK